MEKMKHRNGWQGRNTSPLYLFATMSLGKSLAQFKTISNLLHGTELTYKLLLTLQELRAVERFIFCPTLWKKCSPLPKGPETEHPMWLSSLLRNQKCKRDRLRSGSWFRRWSPVSLLLCHSSLALDHTLDKAVSRLQNSFDEFSPVLTLSYR